MRLGWRLPTFSAGKMGPRSAQVAWGQCMSCCMPAITIQEPTNRWVVSREPAINPAFSLAEVIWILTGRNDAGFLNYFNSALPAFAGHGSCYHGAYGFRLRRHFRDGWGRDLDQLERAYLTLCHEPDSRQAVLQIWDLESTSRILTVSQWPRISRATCWQC